MKRPKQAGFALEKPKVVVRDLPRRIEQIGQKQQSVGSKEQEAHSDSLLLRSVQVQTALDIPSNGLSEVPFTLGAQAGDHIGQ